MKENILIIALAIFAFIFIGLSFDYLKNEKNIQFEEKEYIIISKQITKESTNNFGAFREEYNFLLNNDEIETVDLETFMKYKENDTILITKPINYE
jgi:hypothetical protein